MKGDQKQYADAEAKLIAEHGGITFVSQKKRQHVPDIPPPAPSRDAIVSLVQSIDWSAYERNLIYNAIRDLKRRNYGR